MIRGYNMQPLENLEKSQYFILYFSLGTNETYMLVCMTTRGYRLRALPDPVPFLRMSSGRRARWVRRMWRVRSHGVKRRCGARDDGHESLHMLTPVTVLKPSPKTRLKLGLRKVSCMIGLEMTSLARLWVISLCSQGITNHLGGDEQTSTERT